MTRADRQDPASGPQASGSDDDGGNRSGRLPPEVHVEALAAGTGRVYAAVRDQFITEVVQQAAPPDPAPPSATRTLRRAAAVFTGRRAELNLLLAAADSAGGGAGVVQVRAVDGMPGVGKTALVAHAAALLADRYPDGQHLVELHAHAPGRGPADPAEALAVLLGGLGLDTRHLPAGVEDRAALWRDRLTGRRVLLVLDDAADAAQVEPFLPGPGADRCLVLITSRRRLPGLDTTDTIALDVLPPDDAALLFTRTTRRSPASAPAHQAADETATAEIVRLCGFLPLAITLLAGRIAAHPTWDLTAYAREFAQTRDRLAELAHGDRAVAAAFEMSYQGLPPAQRRMFRRLGLHPGPDADVHAAAALAGTTSAVARRELEALYDAHLIAEPADTAAAHRGPATSRYQMHDLLRAYARTLATHHERPASRDRALNRLLDYYQHTAEAAEHHVNHTARTQAPPAYATGPALPDREAALAWLRTERPNLSACLNHAASEGRHAHVVHTTHALATVLRWDGPWLEAADLHRRAADTAHRSGDHANHARALIDLSHVQSLLGNYSACAALLEQSLDLYRDVGDFLGRATALTQLSKVQLLMGDFAATVRSSQEAGDLYTELGHRLGLATTLNELGRVRLMTGQYSDATDLLQRAHNLYVELGDRLGQANTLRELGRLRSMTGHYSEATDLLQRAQDLFVELGDRLGQANSFLELGQVRSLTGEYPAAICMLERALDLYRGLEHRRGQANAFHDLGRVRLLTGDHNGADDLLRRSLSLFRKLGDRHGEATALNSTGELLASTSDPAGALAVFRQALVLAQLVGSPVDEAQAREGAARALSAIEDSATTRAAGLRVDAAETWAASADAPLAGPNSGCTDEPRNGTEP